MADWGSRLRQHRIDRGLSQEELADEVGISRNYISQIERGVSTNLSLDVARRLSKALGLQLDEPQLPRLPDSLREFAEQKGLQPGEIQVLAGIEYRGQKPDTVEAWNFLYLAIVSVTSSKPK